MKNLLIRILACVLVLTMAFSFAACKGEETKDDGKKDDSTADDKAPTNPDDWWNEGEEPGEGTEGDDPLDGDVDEWDPWDEVKYFAVPNTNAVMNVIDVNADGVITNVELAKGANMVFEYDYTAPAAAEAGFAIVFGEETVKVTFKADGKVAIAKVVGETATDLATSAAVAYTAGSAAKVAIEWNGAKVTVKVNGAEAVSASFTPANTDDNATLKIIGASADVKFENAKATLSGAAIEFETRNGTNWEIITEDGDHKNAIHAGYSGASANNQKSLALISNLDFMSASKITISANIAMGADHRPLNPDGTRGSGNADRGFVVEVWNTNGENGTSPLVYENENISFFKVFLSGYATSASFGKYGATNFANVAQNRDGLWMTLPGGSAGLGQPEEVELKEDGPKNEAGEYVYKAENTFTTYDVGGADAYINLKVEWDRVNYIMSYYYNNTLVKSCQFSRDIFVNDGAGIGIIAASSDVYYKDINLIVE